MIVELTESESEQIYGGAVDGWSFAGAVLSIGAASIAVCTAPAWGAIGGVLAIAAVGANMMSGYANASGSGDPSRGSGRRIMIE